MKNYNWERKWEKHITAYFNKFEPFPDQETADFFEYIRLMKIPMLLSMIEFTKVCPVKVDRSIEENLDKKLYKYKKQDVEEIMDILMMNYFVHMGANLPPYERRDLNFNKIIEHFSSKYHRKNRSSQFDAVQSHFHTIWHITEIIRLLPFKKEYQNMAVIEGIQLIQETTYEQLDQRWHNWDDRKTIH